VGMKNIDSSSGWAVMSSQISCGGDMVVVVVVDSLPSPPPLPLDPIRSLMPCRPFVLLSFA